MKAYLIWLNIEFQKTHDIEDSVVVASKKDSFINKKSRGIDLPQLYLILLNG
jgi:hypothetical protein